MKKQSVCGNCHQRFFTPVTKVYVFKRHFCPYHKEEVLDFDGKNVFSCPKCKRVFHKDKLNEYGMMGTGIMGTARTWEEAQKRIADGKTDYDKIMVPTEQYCQSCKNFAIRKMQLQERDANREKAGTAEIKDFPKDIKDSDIYRYEINKKVQEDFRTEQQRLQQEQKTKAQEEQAKKAEAAAKTKIIKDMSKELTKKEEDPFPMPDAMKKKILTKGPLKSKELEKLFEEKEKAS